ncbi:hypothetical protein L6164_028148 [Bauhinia variegata]|uniref:Uncharacterized protein n=1 Tax=Bauhinia variegata TaxID=167791 RepID=A0ACB9LV31_BAUVA|nr:hypothetical protein L6164_028148 [Bauhinia variegata]
MVLDRAHNHLCLHPSDEQATERFRNFKRRKERWVLNRTTVQATNFLSRSRAPTVAASSAARMNLCSKCFRDFLIKEQQAASAKAAMEKSLNPRSQAPAANQTMESIIPAEPMAGTSPSSSSCESSPSPSTASGGHASRPKAANRCRSCNKKVGPTGFMCKCGSTFCGTHRYPEKHEFRYDFKIAGRDAIAKANPVVKADKVDRF